MQKLPNNFISAERLVKLFLETTEKDNFKYIVELNSWIYFSEDNVWTIDNAYDDLYIALEKIIEENNSLDFWDNEKNIKRAITNLQRRTNLKIKLKDLDAHDNLLNCNNGVLNLDTLKFIPHGSPEIKHLFITKKANVNYNNKATCPKFLRMLNDMFIGHSEKETTINYLQKILGLALSGYNLEQQLCFLQGSSSNGKTTFGELFFTILGNYAINFDKKYLVKQGTRFDRAYNYELHGARFLLIKDFEQSDKLDESIIKKITGGDSIQFKINGHSFDFKIKGKVFCIVNDLPTCMNGGRALNRRILAIPLFNEIKIQRLTILKDLLEEKDGILNWLLEGYRKIDKEYRLTVPQELKQLGDVLLDQAIIKSSLQIENYLFTNENHVMTIDQAEQFVYLLDEIGKCKLSKNDFKPPLLGKILKKKSMAVHNFNAREKFYLGVGIRKDVFEKRFGTELVIKGYLDSERKLFDTHIVEQIDFCKDVIQIIENELRDADERFEDADVLYNAEVYAQKRFTKEKLIRNLKFLNEYRESLDPDQLEKYYNGYEEIINE